MPRTKKYATNAERQKAYRQNKSRANRNASALRIETKQGGKISRPPVRYYGGKWRIASWILKFFPPHDCYVEPYAGGASVLFQKDPSQFEVINDLNGDVVNFFDMLRSRPDELIRAIELTPFSREEHRRAHTPSPDAIERARRFYVRSRQSFGSGEGEYNTGWRFQKSNARGKTLIDEWNNIDFLWDVARRLKMVQIECVEALKVIERFDSPKTLFYVDPPYLFETRYSNEERYTHEMSNQEHIQLAERLQRIQGMAIVSGYECPLYEELYQGWRRFSKEVKTNANHRATEFLWLSPNATALDNLPMFA